MFESKDKDLDGRLSFEEFMGEQSRAVQDYGQGW